VFWSWTQIQNLVKRYCSPTNLHSSGPDTTDVSELYLTVNSLN
jgi:hypothetical protein